MTQKIWDPKLAKELTESDRRFREGFKVPDVNVNVTVNDPPTEEQVEQAWETLREYAQRDRTGEEWAVTGSLTGEFREWLRPMLMAQRQALLMQVASIEEMLGIKPTTADLRKLAKCDRMLGKEGG